MSVVGITFHWVGVFTVKSADMLVVWETKLELWEFSLFTALAS